MGMRGASIVVRGISVERETAAKAWSPGATWRAFLSGGKRQCYTESMNPKRLSAIDQLSNHELLCA
jgi:hypothetical protein